MASKSSKHKPVPMALSQAFFECDQNVNKCSSVTVLQKVLDQYNEWMGKDSPDPCTKYELFDPQTILDHFHHLLICHSTDHDFDYIYNQLTDHGKCECSKCAECIMFQRHYRDKEQHKDHNITIKTYNINIDNPSTDHIEDAIHEISIQQILDRIHSHYCHSYDIGFKFTSKERDKIKMCAYPDDENDSKWALSDENDTYMSQKKSCLLQTQQILSTKYRVPRCRDDINKFCSVLGAQSRQTDDTKSEIKTYSFGYRYYYWSYYMLRMNDDEYNFDERTNKPYRVRDWYIEEKYDSLKEELLQNKISCISEGQYESLVCKANKNLRSQYAKTISCKCDDWEMKYDIKKHDPIELQHVLAIMVYCNYDQFQYQFSATYRRATPDESDESLKNRHSHYHWLGRFIRETVECFGDKIFGSAIKSFWHGIREEMLFHGTVSNIKGVLSTSCESTVAINFCQNSGLILELNNGAVHDSVRYFSCPWLSDFSSESELLFVGGLHPLRFACIIHAELGEDYSFYVKGLNIINSMFDGKLFEDRDNKYFGKRISKLIKVIMDHYLSRFDDSGTYLRHKRMPPYMDKLICRCFENRTHVCVDWGYMHLKFDRWGNKGYHIAKQYVCHEQCEWIKIEFLCELFYNLKSVEFTNGYKEKIRLSRATIDRIYEFVSSDVSCFNIIKIHCNDHTNPLVCNELKMHTAVTEYAHQFEIIDWSLSVEYDEWLVIKRDRPKQKREKRAIKWSLDRPQMKQNSHNDSDTSSTLNPVTSPKGNALQRKCNYCVKLEFGMRRCAQCKEAHYCSVQCQKRDWELHKKTCKK
eukprot:479963_1